MADYIKQYNEIRIVATGNGQVKLMFAVKMNDGKYYYVYYRKEDFDITEVFASDYKTLGPDDRVVESPEQLTEYFTSYKPVDSPAIVMTDTKDDFAQWKPVSPKGTVAVRQQVTSLFHPSRVELPLPADHSKVMDAGGENVYESDVFWDPTEAMLAIWENASAKLKRIVDFCRKEEANEKKELAVGAARIDALLKFQEKTRSVEERISTKWNSMSTAEKAKALNITKKPVTKTKTKTKKK